MKHKETSSAFSKEEQYSYSIKYIFCKKYFKVFLELQMLKNTPIFPVKIWNFCTILMQKLAIFFTQSHLFPYSIYSLQV